MAPDIENFLNSPAVFTEQELIDDFWLIIHNVRNLLPDKTAVQTKNSKISFKNLHCKANQIAKSLNQHSSDHQLGIGLLLSDSVKIICCLTGVVKSGNYFVSLDPLYPNERLSYMIEDSNIQILLTDTDNLKKTESLAKKEILIINIDEFGDEKNLPDMQHNLKPEDLVQIIYTSGSTGQPKGVLQDYRYLFNSLETKLKMERTRPSDILGQTQSFNYVGPSLIAFMSLITGAMFNHHYIGKEGVSGLAAWLDEQKITAFTTSPTLFRKFINSIPVNKVFSSVRIVYLVGEPILKHDLDAYQKHFPAHSEITSLYASTETLYVSYRVYPHNWEFSEEQIPTGFVSDKAEVTLTDQSGEEIGNGEEGEIIVWSKSISPGYNNLPNLTAEKFGTHPEKPDLRFFRTGDLGKFMPDGQLQHLGRIDRQVKIRGVRVELNSVEDLLLKYPGVHQAVAHLYKDARGNEKLAGYLVPHKGARISTTDLRQELARKLPLSMIPSTFVIMDKIPQTGTGKVDRNALPLPENTRPELPNPYIPAQSEMERELVEIWEDITGISGIGLTDNFFEIGGDSLGGVMLFLEFERKFGMKLPLSLLLSAGTIREQAAILIQENIRIDWKPVIALKQKGTGAPIFLIPGYGGYPIRFRILAEKLSDDTPVYAMQARGMDGLKKPFGYIEESAIEYLKAVREINPDGAYFLGGESAGGLIAYEMARLIQSEGGIVPILILFDTIGPGIGREIRGFSGSTGKFKYYWMLAKKHFSVLTKADWAGKKAYFQYYWDYIKIQSSKILQDFTRWWEINKQEDGLPVELQQVHKVSVNAIKKYSAKPYPGRVILFKARQESSNLGPYNGWNRENIGDFIIHPLDGYHGNILFDPLVSRIAQIINTYLSEEDIP